MAFGTSTTNPLSSDESVTTSKARSAPSGKPAYRNASLCVSNPGDESAPDRSVAAARLCSGERRGGRLLVILVFQLAAVHPRQPAGTGFRLVLLGGEAVRNRRRVGRLRHRAAEAGRG